jgi:hypothetical protein
MHLDEEGLQRLLHGELSRAAETSARAHLAECADCRRRASEADLEEREVGALLQVLDEPVPAIDAEMVAARAGETSASRLPDVATRRRGPRSSRHRPNSLPHADARREPRLAWAAGIAVAVALAGAAYAVPGSPLRAWVATVVAWVGERSRPNPKTRPSVTSVHSLETEPSAAGIAVAAGQDLVIRFTSTQAEGGVQVWLTDESDVVVRAPAGAATFRSDVERLVIDNVGSAATFEIRIPRGAPRVEIRVGDRRVFLKDRANVTTESSGTGGDRYLIPLARSPGLR